MSIDYKEFSGSAALSYGLPADGRITTEVARTPGLEFQMADYSQNNVLRLSSANQEGTLTFQNSFKTESLYMLATAGNGPAIVDVKVNFGDGSSQTFASVSISDWFGGTDYAIKGIGRFNLDYEELEPNSENPRLYQIELALSPANSLKNITSVTITKQGHSGIANIFAFSAQEEVSCGTPTDITAVAGPGNVTISWTGPGVHPTGGYDYYLNTSGIAPTETTTATGNTQDTTLSLNSLIVGETYFLWIRSNCDSEGKGFWKKTQFTTAQVTTVYSAGDLGLDFAFNPDLSSSTSCSGVLSVTVPSGYKIKSTSVSYSITTNESYISEIRSLLVCLTNNTTEDAITFGDEVQDEGTEYYERNDLSIANGLTGTVDFELRAWTVWDETETCNPNFDKVDNNSWKITVVLEAVSLGIDNKEKTAFTTYPNPFTDILTISSVENVNEILVNDFLGKTHRTIQNPGNTLDLSDLSNGLYLVTLKMQDGSVKTIKALKQ